MARQAEAGHVGGAVDADFQHGVAADIVELDHSGHRGLKDLLRTGIGPMSRGDEAGTERLGEDEFVAGSGARIGQDSARVDQAGDGVAELDLGIADRVAPQDDGTGRPAAFAAAVHDPAEPLQVQLVVGIAGQVQRGLGHTAHRIDVAEGIGGGNLAIDERIVHHRREEVDRLNERNLVGQLVDAGVVVRFGADQQVGVIDLGDVAQNLSDLPGGQFARSAGARGVVDEAFLLAEEEHDSLVTGGSWRIS